MDLSRDERPGMAYQRAGIDVGMQERLQEMARQVRSELNGPDGCLERGMSVGPELARRLMKQVLETLARQMTDTGPIASDQPRVTAPLQ